MHKGGKNKHLTAIKDELGLVHTDSSSISNILNSHFSTIGEKMQHLCPKVTHHLPSSQSSSFFLKPFTVEEICLQLQHIDIRKSVRPEDIPSKFIKESAEVLAPTLTKIFNICLDQNTFPDELKIACVIPIFKKSDPMTCGNYRPISLISAFSKIFEKCLFNQINSFLTKFNVINPNQFGFQQNTSTEMAVSTMYEQYSGNIEKGLFTCSVFLDIAKAFDSVDHNILFQKLECYGIRGQPLALIKSYFENRFQYTVVNGCASSLLPVKAGVPQGSVLGPLFFLIFINDLPQSTNLKTTLFADDACLTYGSTSLGHLEETVNKELENVSGWMQRNRLSLNVEKSSFMLIHNKKSKNNIKLQINNSTIQRTEYTKYLGVLVDEKLRWKTHIDQVVKKLSKCMWAICRLRRYTSLTTLKMLYYALAYPHIQYCISTWGGAVQKHLDPLLKMQKRLVRVMLSEPFIAPSDPLFKKLKLLKLEDIYKFQIGKLMFLNHNHLIKLPHSLILSTDRHFHATRSTTNQNYSLPYVRTNIGVNSLSFSGPKVWNSIPIDIKQSTIFSFKNKYKQFLHNS